MWPPPAWQPGSPLGSRGDEWCWVLTPGSHRQSQGRGCQGRGHTKASPPGQASDPWSTMLKYRSQEHPLTETLQRAASWNPGYTDAAEWLTCTTPAPTHLQHPISPGFTLPVKPWLCSEDVIKFCNNSKRQEFCPDVSEFFPLGIN